MISIPTIESVCIANIMMSVSPTPELNKTKSNGVNNPSIISDFFELAGIKYLPFIFYSSKLQFMEAAGRLNNFIDAHQGVPGITTDRHVIVTFEI